MAEEKVDLPDFSYLKRIVRDQLIDILESFSEKKDLVIDPHLMKPLDHIAGASFLKEHGVDKIFKLEKDRIDIGCEKRVYLLRPVMVSTKFIADHINNDKQNLRKREYKLVFVPRKLCVCEMVLEQEGVFGDVSIAELPLDLIPLDSDILSLELPEFFTDYFLEGDQSWLYTLVQSLMTVQTFYGTIPNTYAIGSCAKMILEMLQEMTREEKQYTPPDGPAVTTMVLIDRDVDYVTPLCSQVTYQGLLDDTFGIRSGFIEFGPEVTGKDQPAKLLLNAKDEMFAEIRDRHFSNVFPYLSQKAKALQTGYDKRHTLSSVSDMKSFVSTELKDLRQQHKSLALHIGASEVILKKKKDEDFERHLRTEHNMLEMIEMKENVEYLEECIIRQLSLQNSLRHLCLLSVTNGGVDTKQFKHLKQLFLQSHGYEHLVTFANLKKLGLFTESDKKSTFKTVSKKMNLIPKGGENFDLKNPSHVAYVFSGAYSPLSCRLVEQICTLGGLTAVEEICRMMNVECDSSRRTVSARTQPKDAVRKDRSVMVVFLGGCTYTEVAALRFIGKKKGIRFIVATTAITTGTKLLEQVTER